MTVEIEFTKVPYSLAGWQIPVAETITANAAPINSITEIKWVGTQDGARLRIPGTAADLPNSAETAIIDAVTAAVADAEHVETRDV